MAEPALFLEESSVRIGEVLARVEKLKGSAVSDPEPARAFFAEKQWDWSELELSYLECAAALDPGHFPAALGPTYPAAGEDMLLARSRKDEEAGKLEAALPAADILHKLAPESPRACDRLAYLHHRGGDSERAGSRGSLPSRPATRPPGAPR